MNKIPCDIIKDLLPLYIDEVCSEDSAAAVEAHLEICPACKGYCDGLKTTVVTADNAQEIKAQTDIIKKIRNHYMGIALAVIAALSLAMLLWGLNLPGGDEMGFSLIVFYFLFPLASLILSTVCTAKKSAAFLPALGLVLLSQIFLPLMIFHTFDITLPLILTLIPSAAGTVIGLIIHRIKIKKN